MSVEPKISAKEFATSFKRFLDSVKANTPVQEAEFHTRLRDHFGAEPSELPVVSQSFPTWDHPNVHLAIEAYIVEKGRSAELIGVNSRHSFMGISLQELASPARSDFAAAPVQYVNVPLHDQSVLVCVQQGLYLIREAKQRLAVLVAGPRPMAGGGVTVEVMSADRAAAEHALGQLRSSVHEKSIYRGKVISLACDGMSLTFHQLPDVAREHIILPQGLMERIERPTVRFSEHRERLLGWGRHLKRGILLHGPPGTGKTLTAMHLAGRMKDRTVLLLTGRGLGLIAPTCWMARLFQPSTVIIEDVDLVAEERSKHSCNALLFDLLNEMDGLAEDTDVIFLLTTNRADLLEPALASRPGRVDQAIEIPLPDADCRRRLFELYGRGLKMRCNDSERVIRRTEGVTAAFIRELLRKAALFAAIEGDDINVDDRHLDAALHELVVDGGELTRSLLGAQMEVKRPCA